MKNGFFKQTKETEEFSVITVAILGKKSDRRITDYLIRAFDGICPCLFLTPFGTVRTTDETSNGEVFDPLIIFWDSENAETNCIPDIILLKDSCESAAPLVKENTTVIFHSANRTHLETVQGMSIHAIACGPSERDTITFSSALAEQPVLCVQRSIHTLDGEEMEPFELPIETGSGWARYPLQCVFALLVLLGIPERIHCIFEKSILHSIQKNEIK
ncbi:MAG TPA: hypothetical protein H9662_00655 [Firmicutes bacterium]|nr:hypothetical protein [Bacillota bacterium]